MSCRNILFVFFFSMKLLCCYVLKLVFYMRYLYEFVYFLRIEIVCCSREFFIVGGGGGEVYSGGLKVVVELN